MKQVNFLFVSAVFVTRHVIQDTKEYSNILKEILKIPINKRLKFGNCTEYDWSFNDLFKPSVKWLETNIPLNSNIVNRIYNHLFGIENCYGKSLKEIVEDYKKRKIPSSDIDVINNIRKNLFTDPRIIMITQDNKEYAIYDGWHTALAFALEGKPLPVYLGVCDSFLCYK